MSWGKGKGLCILIWCDDPSWGDPAVMIWSSDLRIMNIIIVMSPLTHGDTVITATRQHRVHGYFNTSISWEQNLGSVFFCASKVICDYTWILPGKGSVSDDDMLGALTFSSSQTSEQDRLCLRKMYLYDIGAFEGFSSYDKMSWLSRSLLTTFS